MRNPDHISKKTGSASRESRCSFTRSLAVAMSLNTSRMKISDTISYWLAIDRVVEAGSAAIRVSTS